jgi:integrase
MNISYPTINIDNKGSFYITFYINKTRHRLYSSKKIGGNIHPNKFKGDKRINMANLLAAEVFTHFNKGGKFTENGKKKTLTQINYLAAALENKKRQNYSKHYIKLLDRIYSGIEQKSDGKIITSKHVNSYLQQYTNPTSFNTVKKHLNALLEGAYAAGMTPRINYDNKSKKTLAKLHKPFDNLTVVLDELEGYNFNLYLCCLLTYGCLLRPHREIRLLTWGDFSESMSFINLSGYQNKSGRNRIVPVPNYIRKYLKGGLNKANIFSNSLKPFNEDYFKSLWTKYKTQSKLIQPYQTLYSFRHTGAINLFKKTGSIIKLQKALGHSSINVSLTYLRGLQISELSEADMPSVSEC